MPRQNIHKLAGWVRGNRVTATILKWLHKLSPEGPSVVRVLTGPARGKRIVLDLQYQWSYWLGIAEPHVEQALRGAITEGSIFYDVGAHVGYFSLASAAMAGSGQVFAFEPNPHNVEMLRRTVQLNPDLHFHLIPRAVGASSGSVEFALYEQQEGVANPSLLGRLAELADSGAPNSISVEMIDLDSFSQERGDGPDVVKIDVEGAEGMVLQGMARILSTTQPILIIEVHHKTAQNQVFEQLSPLGYSIEYLSSQEEYPVHVLALPPSQSTT